MILTMEGRRDSLQWGDRIEAVNDIHVATHLVPGKHGHRM